MSKTYLTKHKDPSKSHQEVRVVAPSWFDAEICLIEQGLHDLEIIGELVEEGPFDESKINSTIKLN